MKKIIHLCLSAGLVLCSISGFAEEDLENTLDDMGVKTAWDSTTSATPGKINKSPRYKRQMRNLNRAYQAGSLTKVEYLNQKRHIDEMNKK